MLCGGCGFKYAIGVQIRWDEAGNKIERCDECSRTKFNAQPDVYLGSSGLQTDENLCDPKTGKEIPFSSKREKAEIMKRLGVRQADSAERQHGYRPSSTKRTYFT